MSARTALLLALLALAGCHANAPLPAARPGADSWPDLAGLSAWHAGGRVAVRSQSEGFSASFDWREGAGRSDIDVRGPLGSGAAHLTRTDASIRIDTGGAAPIEVPAPFEARDAELTQRLGFPLPVAALRFWMLGAPDPARPSTPTADGFEQDGWTVALAGFSAVAAAPAALPTRLTLGRGETRIKVAVNDWHVGAS